MQDRNPRIKDSQSSGFEGKDQKSNVTTFKLLLIVSLTIFDPWLCLKNTYSLVLQYCLCCFVFHCGKLNQWGQRTQVSSNYSLPERAPYPAQIPFQHGQIVNTNHPVRGMSFTPEYLSSPTSSNITRPLFFSHVPFAHWMLSAVCMSATGRVTLPSRSIPIHISTR